MAQLNDLIVTGSSRFLNDTNTGAITASGMLTPNGGVSFTGETALPQFSGSPSYYLGIEGFASGGRVKWQSASGCSVGYASNANYASSAGSAGSVAWSDITGKPITLAASSNALSANGWKTLGGRSSGDKLTVSYASSSPATWNSEAYSATVLFGAQDTKGFLDCGYNTPIVTFGGGSVGGSTDNNPTWYWKLSGTSGKTYTLPSDTSYLAKGDSSGNALYAVSAGSATDSTKMPLAGGTFTGAVTFANNTWNTVGDDVQIGDINVGGTLGIKGINGQTRLRLVPYSGSTANDIYNDGNGNLTITGTTYGTFSGSLSGTATSATSATTASYSNYPNIVAGNEVRFNVNTKPSSATDLHIGYAWSDGTKDAKINSYKFENGNMALTKVYASEFNGALVGNVTGNCSGSSGSCTGNAATATYATSAGSASPTSGSSYYLRRDTWWNSGDTHTVDSLRGGTTFAYNTHDAPATGTIVAFDCSTNESYTLQLMGNYYSNRLYYRNRNGDNSTWGSWRTVIDSDNISSQSVDYATSAGSASSATSATTASKLGSSNVGSATNPIYLNAGTATACTYSLNKTVPSDAVFTDTNNAVTQTATSSYGIYRVLLSGTADDTTRTEGVRKSATLTYDPEGGTLSAPHIDVFNALYALNSNNEVGASINGTGRITCKSMNVQDISSLYTFSKSGGHWTYQGIRAVRSGNVVTMQIIIKGGTSVSAGSNALTGTFSGGPLPARINNGTEDMGVQGVNFYGTSALVGTLNSSGTFNFRLLISNQSLGSNTTSVTFTFVCD